MNRLAPDEQERARRFSFDRDRNRFVAARSTLRTLLGRYLSCVPEQIQFNYGVRGKPAIAVPTSHRLHFNLSHSGSWAVLAIATESVGVDLEQGNPRVEAVALANRFFSTEDRSWLLAHPPEDRQRAFFRLWVAREAVLKADGTGLNFPLDRLAVRFAENEMTAVDDLEHHRRWTVRELNAIPPDYCGAVAIAHPSPRIDPFSLDPQSSIAAHGFPCFPSD